MSIPNSFNPLGISSGRFCVKPGQVIVGNTKEGEKTTFLAVTTDIDISALSVEPNGTAEL